ncbi:MAG: PQQ-binding-like beta-propeller repeat protein [Planctomycetaceae bacterium]
MQYWKIVLVPICLASLTVQAADSPSFRGPRGDGQSTEQVPLRWGPRMNVKWRSALPHAGHGSPVISRGKVFVTCANAKGTQRGLYCFDRKTGKQSWSRVVSFEKVEPTHKTNPYGASTPVSDGRRVVVWHGSAGLFCYDHEGRPLWKLDPGDVKHIWGYASSPILYADRVFLHHGPGVETFMLAVSVATGKVIWKTPEPGGANDRDPRMVASFSTPVLATVGGTDQLICSMATRVVAYDPGNGKVLWSVDGLPSPRGDLVYTSPLISGNIGVAMGGYQGPRMAFRLGGSGNVTKTHRLWRVEAKQPQRIGSGVIVGAYVYISNAGPGTVECIEVKTGKLAWQARLPSGNAWSSTVRAGDHLYVTDQGGTTHVFRPTPKKFDLVASNPIGEKSNATPAFSDGEVFLRTDAGLFCIAAPK